jgi:hypothetical protein
MINIYLNPQYHIYSCHALLSQEIVLTKAFKLDYDNNKKDAEIENTLLAGIYSFPTELARDRFVKRCNNSVSLEVCFPAQFSLPTTEVVDIKVTKPRSKVSKTKPATGPVAKRKKEK